MWLEISIIAIALGIIIFEKILNHKKEEHDEIEEEYQEMKNYSCIMNMGG